MDVSPKDLLMRGRAAVIAASKPGDWRAGRAPDYQFSLDELPKQRTNPLIEGTLIATVERIVQVFEMEISHKHDPSSWVGVVADRFRTRINGGEWFDSAAVADRGSYNLLIGDNPYYDGANEDFDSSHRVFHTALPGGFFWEVLDVLSPPPTVTFTWRHWGVFDGEYKGFQPTGETVELFGISVARVDDELRVVELEHYYDNHEFLRKLTGNCPVTAQAGGCPVAKPGDSE